MRGKGSRTAAGARCAALRAPTDRSVGRRSGAGVLTFAAAGYCARDLGAGADMTHGGDNESPEAAEGPQPPATGFAWGALFRGLRVVFSVPSALLFAAGLGFGALARDGGFDLAQTAFIAASMMALPNQVVLVDQLARNETLIAAAFAVALAALRLLPMTVTLVPLLKGPAPTAPARDARGAFRRRQPVDRGSPPLAGAARREEARLPHRARPRLLGRIGGGHRARLSAGRRRSRRPWQRCCSS